MTSRIEQWNKAREENWFYADLRSANLSGANLSGANLSGANLRSADLRSADLRSADLSGADLSGANLRSANLRSADLRSADLRSADLSGANLRSADLSGANLRSADHIIRLSVGDPRGYDCVARQDDDGNWMVYAGCQTHTLEGAFSHWSEINYKGEKRIGSLYIRALKQFVEEFDAQETKS